MVDRDIHKKDKKQKLEELNKDICKNGNGIIYDYIEDDEGNPVYLFMGTKDIYITSNFKKNMIKVFKMNEYEYVAGRNLDECKKFLCDLVQLPENEVIENPHELSGKEMEKLIFKEDLNDDNSPKRTFQEELWLLINKNTKFPCIFATNII